jgi:hypothetical protein
MNLAIIDMKYQCCRLIRVQCKHSAGLAAVPASRRDAGVGEMNAAASAFGPVQMPLKARFPEDLVTRLVSRGTCRSVLGRPIRPGLPAIAPGGHAAARKTAQGVLLSTADRASRAAGTRA